jgi:hypothetical protein
MEFASAEWGGELLGRVDRWARQLSAFDRAARQRTLEPTTMEELLAFVSGSALSWTSEEQAYWSRLVDRLSEAVNGLMLSVPEIFLVKTTGLEEFGFAYAATAPSCCRRGGSRSPGTSGATSSFSRTSSSTTCP